MEKWTKIKNELKDIWQNLQTKVTNRLSRKDSKTGNNSKIEAFSEISDDSKIEAFSEIEDDSTVEAFSEIDDDQNSDDDSTADDRVSQIVKALKERKEIISITLLSLVLIALIFSFVIPTTKANIITKETASLVGNQYRGNSQVELVPYNGIEEAVVGNESITLAIIDQKDPNYETFQKVLSDAKNTRKLDDPVYLYPLVDDKDKVASYFKIQDGLTLIHFENKKETARKSLTDADEINDYLFDYLKSLGDGKAAMSAAELEKLKAKASKEETDEKKSNNNSDVIDELKDIII